MERTTPDAPAGDVVDATDRTDAAGEDLAVLRFGDGIPGFAQAHRFALSDLNDDGTFQVLTCLDDPELSMVVASPWLFFPDYAPDLPDGDRRVLELTDPTDAVVFCSVTVDEDAEQLLLNLRAPFVANGRTRDARQVVLDEDHPLRAPVPTGA
jgi:flagellar assembly factor FliW